VSRAAALLAAVALGLSTTAGAGDWTWGAELASGYDSNIGNAAHHRDVFDSGTAYAGIGSGWEQRFSSYTALQIGGSLSGEQYSNMSELSNLGGQLRLRLLHKPGRGFFTPVLGAWVSAGARDYGSSIRDSTDTRAGVSAALPVTTAVQVRAEAQWTDRESSGRVFDLRYASYALNADWAVAPDVTVYGTMRFNEGQYAVTAFGYNEVDPKTEHRYLEPRADRIELDDAFAADWWAFRIEKETWIGTVGVNLPLSSMMAFDAQVQRSQSGTGK